MGHCVGHDRDVGHGPAGAEGLQLEVAGAVDAGGGGVRGDQLVGEGRVDRGGGHLAGGLVSSVEGGEEGAPGGHLQAGRAPQQRREGAAGRRRPLVGAGQRHQVVDHGPHRRPPPHGPAGLEGALAVGHHVDLAARLASQAVDRHHDVLGGQLDVVHAAVRQVDGADPVAPGGQLGQVVPPEVLAAGDEGAVDQEHRLAATAVERAEARHGCVHGSRVDRQRRVARTGPVDVCAGGGRRRNGRRQAVRHHRRREPAPPPADPLPPHVAIVPRHHPLPGSVARRALGAAQPGDSTTAGWAALPSGGGSPGSPSRLVAFLSARYASSLSGPRARAQASSCERSPR